MKNIIIIFIVVATGITTLQCGSSSSSSGTATASSKSNSAVGNWKLGIQTWTFRMFTLQEAIAKADSAGVKHLEAFWGQRLSKDLNDTFGIRLSPSGRAALKDMLKSKGISLTAMGVISPRTRAEWEQAFELAKEFGLSYITSEPRKDLWDMIDSLAGSYRIKVAIHEHGRPNPYWHPDSVLAAIKNHPNLECCADLGHWARSGLDPVDCLKKLEGHVIGVHLKDIATFNDLKAADVPVGKGVINYPAVFDELARQRFSGMLSIEQESNWYASLPDVINTVKYYNSQVSRLSTAKASE
jgi:sugar phosphate isomerase/epimerase